MKRREIGKKKSLTMGQKAELALKSAVKKAIEEHKRAGVPIVVWKNGKTVIVPPEKL